MSNPFVLIRKYQKAMLVFFGVILMAIFGLGPAFDYFGRQAGGGGKDDSRKTLVKYKGGTLSKGQISEFRMRHFQTQNFIAQLQREASKDGRPTVPELLTILPTERYGRELSDRTTVDSMMLVAKAKEEGIVIGDSAVDDFLLTASGGKINLNQYPAKLKKTFGSGFTMAQLRDHLKKELAGINYEAMMHTGIGSNPTRFSPPSPIENWVAFNRLYRKAVCDAMPLKVEEYVDKVTAEPDAKEIAALYEKGKAERPDPTHKEPGFRTPDKARLGYFMVDQSLILDEIKRKISDEEVQTVYESYVEKKDPLVIDKSAAEEETDEPAAEESDSTETGKTGEEKAGEEKTGDEKSGEEKAGEEKSGEEKAGEEKSGEKKASEEKSGADKAADNSSSTETKATEEKSDDADSKSDDSAAEESKSDGCDFDPALQDDAEEKKEEPKSDASKDEPKKEEPKTDDTKTDDAKTDDTKTDDTKTDDTKKDDTKTDDTKTDDTKTDDTKTDDTETKKPSATPPEGVGAKPVKFKPLDKLLADQIRDRMIARDEKFEEQFAEAREDCIAAIDNYLIDVEEWEIEQKDGDKNAPKPDMPDFEEVAEKNYAIYGETDEMMSYEEFSKHRFGARMIPTGNRFSRPVQVADYAFQNFERQPVLQNIAVDVPRFSVNSLGQTYIVWYFEKEESHIPTLDECRRDIVEFWQFQQGLKDAMAEAESIAQQIRDEKKTLMASYPGKTTSLGQFTWLTSDRSGFGGQARISSIFPMLDMPGEDFMKTVFSLEEGEIGVAPDAARENVFVIQLTSIDKNEEALRNLYFTSPLVGSSAMQASNSASRDIFANFREQLNEEMGVEWLE